MSGQQVQSVWIVFIVLIRYGWEDYHWHSRIPQRESTKGIGADV